MWKQRTTAVAMIWVLLMGIPACAHYRLCGPKENCETDYKERTFHTYFWGGLQANEVAENCISNALEEVVVTKNLWHNFATVLTLGIWNPIEIKWKCRKEPRKT